MTSYPTRTISQLQFEVISPSVYRLAGSREEVFILYLSQAMTTTEKVGWYVCHQAKNGKLLRSNRFHTVGEAACMVHRVLKSVEQTDLLG